MSDSAENLKTELVSALKSAFEELVHDALTGAKGDLKSYGQQLAQEYGKYLWRAYKDNDDVARENLKDLKAQVLHIAVRREIIVTYETIDKIKTILEVAAKIGLKALIAAAVAL